MHENFAALARKLIGAHGRPISILTRVNTGTAMEPVFADTANPVTAYQSKSTDEMVNGTKVFSTDRKYLIDPDFVPEINSIIDDNGEQLTIVAIKKTQPGTTLCLQTIWGRV